MTLGEPDGRGVDDSWFTYESIAQRGGLRWMMAVVGASKAGVSRIDNWDTSRRLIVRFAADGMVTAVSFDQKECNAAGSVGGADCFDASGSDLASEEAKHRAGVILSRYDRFRFVESDHPGCEYPSMTSRQHTGVGRSFSVGEHALVWQDEIHLWHALPLQNIQEVRPLEKHWPNDWLIPIKRVDGSCMFISVGTEEYLVINWAKELQEKARAAILESIQGASREHGNGAASH
jgi:hypothetical protein